MNHNLLLDLPEAMLCPLFSDWLTIDHTSQIDLTFCVRGYRDRLLKNISECSMLHPFNTRIMNRFRWSKDYWKWLVDRNFSVNHIQLTNSSGIESLMRLLMEPTGSESLLGRIQSINLLGEFGDLAIVQQFSTQCTNLKDMSFFINSITDQELSLILENNCHLTQLSLKSCNAIIGMNLSSTSLKNIKDLTLDSCEALDYNGFNRYT